MLEILFEGVLFKLAVRLTDKRSFYEPRLAKMVVIDLCYLFLFLSVSFYVQFFWQILRWIIFRRIFLTHFFDAFIWRFFWRIFLRIFFTYNLWTIASFRLSILFFSLLLHTLGKKCLLWLACLWSKCSRGREWGRKGGSLPLAFQYLILMIWRPCDLNLIMISSLASNSNLDVFNFIS